MLDGNRPGPDGDDVGEVDEMPNVPNEAEENEALRRRLEVAVYNSMLGAYGTQESPAEENRISRVAIIRSQEVVQRAELEQIEVPVALVEMMLALLPELSRESKYTFILGKSTIYPIMKAISQTKGYEEVDFGKIEEYPYLEQQMIKASGGKKKFAAGAAKLAGISLVGIEPAGIKQAFENLVRFAELLHKVQDAHHPHSPSNTEVQANEPEEAGSLIIILEEQGFGPDDVENRPFTVKEMLDLMEIEVEWFKLDQPFQAQVIYNMSKIADHFGMKLVTGPRGPELIKS